jgi:hypothetical protein
MERRNEAVGASQGSEPEEGACGTLFVCASLHLSKCLSRLTVIPAKAHCCPGKMRLFKKCAMLGNFPGKFNATESSSQRKLGSSAFDAL